MVSQIGSKRAFENSDPETPVEIGSRKRPASLRRKRIPKRYCDDGSPSPAAIRLLEDDQFKVEAVDEEEIEVKEEDAVESEEEDDFYIGNQVEEIDIKEEPESPRPSRSAIQSSRKSYRHVRFSKENIPPKTSEKINQEAELKILKRETILNLPDDTIITFQMSKLEALFELVKCGICKIGRFKMHIGETKDSFEIRCNKCNLVAATKKIIFSKEEPKEEAPEKDDDQAPENESDSKEKGNSAKTGFSIFKEEKIAELNPDNHHLIQEMWFGKDLVEREVYRVMAEEYNSKHGLSKPVNQ